MGLQLDQDQALDLWRTVTVLTVRADARDLTARQQAVLMTVYLGAGTHTVRGLAAALGLAKPAVTRALDTLCGMGLLRRAPDARDRRSVIIERTASGQGYIAALGALIRDQAAGLGRARSA